ncbi:MAG: GDSL-type esterase/lipase family protein [Desulfobulbus sp.]|jgi:lysophospholipase L1-like esterase
MTHLLMLGDSLVEWGHWERLLPEIRVTNRGRAGEMTEELAARLHDELDDCPDPDAVLVQSGTNNLLMGYVFFPAIMATMLERIRFTLPAPPIIVCSLLPMSIVNATKIAEVNQELAQATAAIERCTFLDLALPFSQKCLPPNPSGFLADQVHLSLWGYQVWADEIRRCLQEQSITGNPG